MDRTLIVDTETDSSLVFVRSWVDWGFLLGIVGSFLPLKLRWFDDVLPNISTE